MKKTLIALLALGSVAMAETISNIIYTSSNEDPMEWNGTIGGEEYTKNMVFGDVPTAGSWSSTPNITGGNFFAGDYTVSIWVDIMSLDDESKVLFAYSGGDGTGNLTCNAISWNGGTKTLSIGRGKLITSAVSGGTSITCTYDSSNVKTSETITLPDPFTHEEDNWMINFTFSVVGKDGGNQNPGQVATLYVDGNKFQEFTGYNGNMNGGAAGTQMNIILNNGGYASYNEVALANAALDAAGVVKLMGVQKNVPEPTTGALSLLALAGLCARRRK